jgi:hypothetical protein
MTSVSNSNTAENLLFWTMGYGGWLGVALLPVVWSLPAPASKGVKLLMSLLIPSMSAILLTGFFYSFYGIAYVTYTMSSIMIHPAFLKSCVGSVCIALSSIGLYVVQHGKTVTVSDAEESEESEEDAEESEESEEDAEESEEEEEEAEYAEDSQDEDEEDEDAEANPQIWRSAPNNLPPCDNVNTDPLRNAPPLSDNEIA